MTHTRNSRPPSNPLSESGFARNPEYVAFIPIWTKCRDAAAGQDAIHAKTTHYLPQLSGMEDGDYKQYLRRAMFYNAMGRTASGLTGTVMRKPIIIEYPAGQLDELETLGVSDETIQELIARTIHTQLIVGRIGHLVDAPATPVGEDGGTTDEAKIEPFVSEYTAESILNWHEERVHGRMVLVLVVLHERHEVLTGPKHSVKVLDRFRVLRLGVDPAVVRLDSDVRDDHGNLIARKGDGSLAEGFKASDLDEPFYYQEIWVFALDENGDQTDELILEDIIVPRMSAGRLLTEIPFQFTGVKSDEPSPEKPPLLDLVNVNLSHYMNSADLEWGRHFTCLPTPWVAGGDPKQRPLIGSSIAWVIPDSDAKVGMLEFTGAGLGHLKDGMEHKERLMAILGSRLLEDNKAGVEAAEAIKLRLTGDSAVLASIAFQASASWTKILNWVWQWTNIGETSISVTLNTDFNPARLPAADQAVLMQSFQAHLIDFDTWYYNLEAGEILPPGMTQAKFRAGLLMGIPGEPAMPDNTGHLDDGDDDGDGDGDGDGNTGHLDDDEE